MNEHNAQRPAVPVENALRRRLADWGPACIGHAFHSERDIAAEFGITRDTVRRALQPLVDDGMLETRRGAPTRIRSHLPRPDPIPSTGQLRELADDALCDLEDRVRAEVRRRWQPDLALGVRTPDPERPRVNGEGLRPRS